MISKLGTRSLRVVQRRRDGVRRREDGVIAWGAREFYLIIPGRAMSHDATHATQEHDYANMNMDELVG